MSDTQPPALVATRQEATYTLAQVREVVQEAHDEGADEALRAHAPGYIERENGYHQMRADCQDRARQYVAAHFPVRRKLRKVEWRGDGREYFVTWSDGEYFIDCGDAGGESFASLHYLLREYRVDSDATLSALLALPGAPEEEDEQADIDAYREHTARQWQEFGAKVWDTLDELCPGWNDGPKKNGDNAVAAIRAMGQRKVDHEAFGFVVIAGSHRSLLPYGDADNKASQAETAQRMATAMGGTIHELLLGDAVPGTGGGEVNNFVCVLTLYASAANIGV